jgi:hypothetical protein
MMVISRNVAFKSVLPCDSGRFEIYGSMKYDEFEYLVSWAERTAIHGKKLVAITAGRNGGEKLLLQAMGVSN